MSLLWIFHTFFNLLNVFPDFLRFLLYNFLKICLKIHLISGLFGITCGVFVLYWPKLKLPDSPDFKLFVEDHIFELYDTKYKDLFWFEKIYTVSSFFSSLSSFFSISLSFSFFISQYLPSHPRLLPISLFCLSLYSSLFFQHLSIF